jgi:hypothetical protein
MSDEVEIKYDIPPFVIVPNWIAEMLKPTELATYVALGKYADNKTKECWPSLNTIAKDLRKSKTSVITAIKALEKKGAIKVDKRKNDRGDWARNHYTLMVYGGSKENLTTPSKENTTTGSKENKTRGSKENLTLTIPNTTKLNKLYTRDIQTSYKDEIVRVLGLNKISSNMWKQIETTAKQLFEAEVGVNQIEQLARNILISYGESALSHRSLPNHLDVLERPKVKKSSDYKKVGELQNLERWVNEQ